MRHDMFTKTTVLLFASNNHYTAVTVELRARSMAYFDGLNPNPTQCPWEILLVKQLYEDEARRQGLQAQYDEWTILYPARHMQRQQPYRDNDSPQANSLHL